MAVKEVSETGQDQEARTPSSPPPLLTAPVPVVSLTDIPQSAIPLGNVTMPISYVQVEPKQVLGCVVFREADNLAAAANWMDSIGADPFAGQVQVRNAVSGNWVQVYTFVSGQVYVSGSTGPGDVLVGTTPVSGLGYAGQPMRLQLRGVLEFRLVSGVVAVSGMNLRDVRVGVIPVY